MKSSAAPGVVPLIQEVLEDCVLIIEDNTDAAESLRLLLEARGARAAVAYDGPEGVRLGLELRPRAAVIDIGLPGFDGYEVCRRLRARLGPAAVLVAHTAYAGGDAPLRAREAGFDALLAKPTEPSELLRLLGAAG
jgi:CheY-like chemotaxis protein